ncbi:MAG: TolC family protein [Magnetococcales bacterium]|nr:TolC family protein [Magnetococcales bacterium]
MSGNPAIAFILFGTLLLFPGIPMAQEPVIGATVDEFLVLAARMNPERAAARLDEEAALARAEGAGALPDPVFQWSLEDISQNRASLPGRVGSEKFTVQQEVPWWGKRKAEREIAQARSREAGGRLAQVEAELALRIKTAYAEGYRVRETMARNGEGIKVLETLERLARSRYAQGMGDQEALIAIEAQRSERMIEQVRLTREWQRIQARLNVLVHRKPDAPIVDHPELRPLPAKESLDAARLWQRALDNNPALVMAKARLLAAMGDRQLAEVSWYPDFSIDFGLIDRREPGENNGYEASIALNLPLQQRVRQGRLKETMATVGALRETLRAEQARLEGELHEAISSMEEVREVTRIITGSLVPQGKMALQTALNGYRTGIGAADSVWDAVGQLQKKQVDLIEAYYEGQVRLARIEHMIGGQL